MISNATQRLFIVYSDTILPNNNFASLTCPFWLPISWPLWHIFVFIFFKCLLNFIAQALKFELKKAVYILPSWSLNMTAPTLLMKDHLKK